MNLSRKLVTLIFSSSLSTFAHAGGISSGGGEIITYQNNPWFIGSEPVKVCIEKSENFSMLLSAAKNDVSLALKDWLETFTKMKIELSDDKLPDGKTKTISTTFVIQNDCDETSELKVLLGVMNADVRKTIRSSPNGYVSFAKMTAFNTFTGRGKGYIWFAPDLGEDAYKRAKEPFWGFHGLLPLISLHELGHVFGIRHNSSPFMNEAIPEEGADFAMGDYKKYPPHKQKLPLFSSRGYRASQFFAWNTVHPNQYLCLGSSKSSSSDSKMWEQVFGIRSPINHGEDDFCLRAVKQRIPTPKYFMDVKNGLGDEVSMEFNQTGGSGSSAAHDSIVGRYLTNVPAAGWTLQRFVSFYSYSSDILLKAPKQDVAVKMFSTASGEINLNFIIPDANAPGGVKIEEFEFDVFDTTQPVDEHPRK